MNEFYRGAKDNTLTQKMDVTERERWRNSPNEKCQTKKNELSKMFVISWSARAAVTTDKDTADPLVQQ